MLYAPLPDMRSMHGGQLRNVHARDRKPLKNLGSHQVSLKETPTRASRRGESSTTLKGGEALFVRLYNRQLGHSDCRYPATSGVLGRIEVNPLRVPPFRLGISRRL